MNYLKLLSLSIFVLLYNTNVNAQSGKKTKPNVIIIYSDDQGYADLNIYGSKDLYTPNLDKLARSGVRFTQFYAASPICSPSRASLLTGRYPQRAGLPNMASSKKGDPGMPGDQFTLGEMFKEAGYFTAHVGKWHVGYSKETEPNAQGFDYSFGFMGGCLDNYSHFFYWNGPNRHDLWENGEEIYRPGQYLPDLMVEKADSIFDKAKSSDQPFFLYWAINLPHYPLQGLPKWLDYYKNLPSPRNKYAAFISTMDEKVGQLMDQLKKDDLLSNTIVIFQSDQGFSKEGRTFGGGGSAGIYRGSKYSLFEGGIRVPAMISWPGTIQPDQVRDQMVINTDWFPTLAELCNIALPSRKIDGKSLVSVLKNKNAGSPHQDALVWQSRGTKENPQWAVRKGHWKLLHNPVESKKSELTKDSYFLVDLDKDPGEQHNKAEKHPDIVQEFRKIYDSWVIEVQNQ